MGRRNYRGRSRTSIASREAERAPEALALGVPGGDGERGAAEPALREPARASRPRARARHRRGAPRCARRAPRSRRASSPRRAPGAARSARPRSPSSAPAAVGDDEQRVAARRDLREVRAQRALGRARGREARLAGVVREQQRPERGDAVELARAPRGAGTARSAAAHGRSAPVSRRSPISSRRRPCSV